MSTSPSLPISVAVVPVTAFQQNCSIIWDTATKEAAVVDPGGDLDSILARAQRDNLQITKILITHAHIDHAGATLKLQQMLNVPIEGPHPDEQFWIDRLSEDGARYGIESFGAFTPTRWLFDHDEVTVGNQILEVIHCPGHTPGHVIFYHRATKFAIVGDVIFKSSIGRTDFPKGNHADLIHSIREKLFPLGDDVRFLPGHGPLSTFGEERRSNPFVSDRAVAAS
jgi:glyoxylase-like metal-dependent hydrolase (beta-lactamase superfamily II)